MNSSYQEACVEVFRLVSSWGASQEWVSSVVDHIEAGIRLPYDINKIDGHGNTLLHMAAMIDRKDLAEKLLFLGADPDLANLFGWTPVHCACGVHAESVLTTLIDSGANTYMQDHAGFTPLAHALSEAVEQQYLSLLAGGVLDERENSAINELSFLGAYLGKLSALRPFKSKLTLIHLREMGVEPVVLYADRSSFEAIADSLLVSGADINCTDENCETPMHDAAYSGDVQVLEYLLGRDAKVDMESVNGETPMHFASLSGHANVIRALSNGGSSLNVSDRQKNTPLHLAVGAGHLLAAEELGRLGANWFLKNKEGLTPAALSEAYGRGSVKRLMVKSSLV